MCHRKKKLEITCDLACESGGSFRELLGHKPTYGEAFGIWLNRKRNFYRRASAVAYGAGIAIGVIEPGDDYFKAIADGEGEALLLKAKFRAAKGG